MSATDELRRLLDERGVEWWETTKYIGATITSGGIDRHYLVSTCWISPMFGMVEVTYMGDGVLYMARMNECKLTPERAVEVTLRSRKCKNVHEPPKDATFWPAPHFKCSVCGKTHVSTDYVYFCPNCGAEVTE